MTSIRAALLAAIVLAGPGAAPADEVPPTYSATGSDLFRALLKFNGLEPVTESELIANTFEASSTVLVVWGTLPDNNAFIPLVRRFVNEGGGILIATNEPVELGLLINGLPGIRITGSAPSRRTANGLYPVEWHSGLESPFKELKTVPAADVPTFDRLQTPSPRRIEMLVPVGPFQRSLAYIPNWNWQFAVGGEGSRAKPYRFLVYADQNVLANGMLVHSSANAWFAQNTIQFLQKPTNRKRCLLLEHGRIVEKFPLEFASVKLPDTPLPLPGWQQLQTLITEQANRTIDRLETDDTLNRQFLGKDPATQNRRLADHLRALAIAATVCAVIYLLRKVLRSRQPQDPVLTTSRAVRPTEGTLLGRRSDELLLRDNLVDLARAAVRDLFRDVGGAGLAGPALPPVVFPHGEPAGMHRRIRDLWRLGHAPDRPVVRAARWDEFEQNLDVVRQAAADGLWRFAARPGEPR